MHVVIVESPAKAKTINKYLGPDYTVLASYGHVRDLPAKDGSVRPDEDFAVSWEVEDRAEKRVREIVQAIKGADSLYLATDPDREGEAISWHVQAVLAERRALKGIPVKRVVFNEVTKQAVLDAFAAARDLDHNLVDAYLARRALDYLVGFTLSPVLWRKLPGSRSAGRVQSVALRLVCERETEIEAFVPREYWTVIAEFQSAAGLPFKARLTHLDGRKLDRFDLGDEAAAKAALAAAEGEPGYTVAKVEHRQVRRHPQPPFTTSTLQQEASRKLGFGATRTMQMAQRLYEGIDLGGETIGLITYMRTDGVQLSQEAIAAARRLIETEHGERYRPAAPRQYKTVAKNAQEAHEAIRPTDVFRKPHDVARYLDPDQLRLYELIWKRTVASQMESATLDQATVDIAGAAGRAGFRATGSVMLFDGFLKLYEEGRDDDTGEESDRRLPPLKDREAVTPGAILPEQHFTEPPPRYTEASLVKKLEELGIGRPSTYASIIQVLQDRDYVRLDKKRFVPVDRGRLVTAFLESFFERYVQYNFTADLENLLDEVAAGRADWKQVLRDFWMPFSQAVLGTKDLTVSNVLDALDHELGPHFFPPAAEGGRDPRLCPVCNAGRLSLKLGKFGAFIGCANYPECRYTRPLAVEGAGKGEGGEPVEAAGPRHLGTDPLTGNAITLRAGPYGTYVQAGEASEGVKPKRVSLPKSMPAAELTLEQALALLALPREIGPHPESGEMITAGLGRFGPYLKRGPAYKSLPAGEDVLTIGINRAVDLLAQQTEGKGRRGVEPLRSLGAHPETGEPVNLFKGRYGPYISHGGIIASLPRGADIEAFGLGEAVPLLAEQAKKPKSAKAKSGARSGAKSGLRMGPAKPAPKPRATKTPIEAVEPAAKAKPKAKPAAKAVKAKPAAKAAKPKTSKSRGAAPAVKPDPVGTPPVRRRAG